MSEVEHRVRVMVLVCALVAWVIASMGRYL